MPGCRAPESIYGAPTVLTDDPIFDHVCLGGDWQKEPGNLEVAPHDSLRRRFHAMPGNGGVHFTSDTDRFAAGQPIVLKEDLSEIRFQLESDNPAKHTATLHLAGLKPGRYTVRDDKGVVTNVIIKDEGEYLLNLAIDSRGSDRLFTMQRTGTPARE